MFKTLLLGRDCIYPKDRYGRITGLLRDLNSQSITRLLERE